MLCDDGLCAGITLSHNPDLNRVFLDDVLIKLCHIILIGTHFFWIMCD